MAVGGSPEDAPGPVIIAVAPTVIAFKLMLQPVVAFIARLEEIPKDPSICCLYEACRRIELCLLFGCSNIIDGVCALLFYCRDITAVGGFCYSIFSSVDSYCFIFGGLLRFCIDGAMEGPIGLGD